MMTAAVQQGSSRPELKELPLLPASECAAVAGRVRALRDSWTPRAVGGTFFTLGAASYLDGPSGLAVYQERAELTNPLLRREFGWLLDRVHECLAAVVGAPVATFARAALPGFHVFEFDPGFARGSSHFDLQYEHVDWEPLGGMDPRSQSSYTLPIELPASGGGLDTFDIFSDDLEGLSVEEKRAFCESRRQPTYHDYEPGRLVLHSGRQMHRIRAFRPEDDGSRSRITLQGHLIRTGEGWISYW